MKVKNQRKLLILEKVMLFKRVNGKCEFILMADIKKLTIVVFVVICLTAASSYANESCCKKSKTVKNLVTFRSFGEGSSLIGLIDVDGTNERYIELEKSGKNNWFLGPMFSDKRRIIAASMEKVPVSEVIAGKSKSNSWIYDFKTGELEQLFTKDRPAVQMACAGILPGEKRLLLDAFVDGSNRIFVSDLDGGNLEELTTPEDGYVYGQKLSPDGKKVAFHVLGKVSKYCPSGNYSINTIDLEKDKRYLIDSKPNHLFFGPAWSPDSQWVAYLDCLSAKDKAHFYADVCVGKADGTVRRNLTNDQSHWFGTSFGSKQHRGGGSNFLQWTADGKILYTRLIPGSRIDCYFDPNRPNHEEYVYAPQHSKGGAQLCLLDPDSGKVTELTTKENLKWDFMASASANGKYIVFLRHRVADFPTELWIMNRDGSNQRLLTKGYKHKGVSLTAGFLEISF